jgi:hypothetical protein
VLSIASQSRNGRNTNASYGKNTSKRRLNTNRGFMKLIRNLLDSFKTNLINDLPPVGWWAKCAYTGEYHRIVAHDLISVDAMALTVDHSGYWGAYDYHWTDWRKEKPEGENVYEP